MNFLKQGKTNWKYILIIVTLAIVVCGGILDWIKMQEVPSGELLEIKKPEKIAEEETAKLKTYQSPDSLLYAQIIPAKQTLIGNAYENRVEIRTKEDRLLQTEDYTSEDGDHGLIVDRAEWTPDSQFFIYDAYSSGGHQPWFLPVYFYSGANNKIYYFSDVSGFTVAGSGFTVVAPDIVTFTVYTSHGMGPTTTKSFKLSEIIGASVWKAYRNKKYSIEFQYPNPWILDDKEILSINLPDQTKNFIQINVSNGVSGQRMNEPLTARHNLYGLSSWQIT